MRILLACLLALAPGWATAHEVWIDAEAWQLPAGAPLVGQLKNGQEFQGRNLSFVPAAIDRFDLVQNGTITPVPGRAGDRPALNMAPATGLAVVVYEAPPSTVTYKTWEDWLRFAAHKDLSAPLQRQTARNLPLSGFKERYTRHVKALFAIGDGAGADRATGLATEFVARTNPYTQAGPVEVQLLLHGAPRTGAQIEVFDRAPDGTVTISTDTRTDAMGRAQIPVTPGHTYLLDAVTFQEASGDAVWQTLWAALTFAVPVR